MLCRVDWYREFSAQQPLAWLATDKSGESVAFGKERAFRVLTGGWIRKEGDRIFELPLSTVDNLTGLKEDMMLSVPLTGEVQLPETNIAEPSENHFKTWGPFLLGITRLSVDGDIFSVTLGMENWNGVARFNLSGAK